MMRIRGLHEGQAFDGGEEFLDRPGARWIDVQQPDEATLGRLAERFGLHRLAIEDCLHLDQRPKLEEFPGHLFIVLQAFSCTDKSLADVTLHELHFFLGPDWLITVHERSHRAIDQVHKRLDADPSQTLGRGVDFVAYLLADAQVDLGFPLMDHFTEALDELEDSIFQQQAHKPMERIFALKRQLVLVRKVLSPQREVLTTLARRGLPGVSERTTLYFRDVCDHLVRILEQVDTNRELVANVREAWLSVVANRTNDITRQLTVLASIFLPLSFIAGFFGQNFDALSRPPFFVVMLASMVLVPAGMVAWFQRKGWF
ncbi:MAG: magnesium/cobalt transporter CorA [Myxococcaceae bacterium]|jgi:magnesium transporter|nr:magnesium/cobalt transporter CorA [Myxococcaceae bacterium]MCA3013447.1 magnesium/cobalt transporter CorA [Myxococcaceae bacterium]